jgi:hypothetical protein
LRFQVAAVCQIHCTGLQEIGRGACACSSLCNCKLSDRVFVLSMCCAVLPQISLLQWAHVMSDVLELPGMPWCSVARTVADLDASGRIQFSKFLDRCATCVHVCHHLLPCANECLCG